MAQPVHLVVAVHGLWGGPDNLDFLCDTLATVHGGVRSPAPPSAPSPSKDTASAASPPAPSTPRRVSSASPDTSRAPLMVVLNSSVNRWVNTYDGIDWCAERVIREADKEINRIHAWATSMAEDPSLEPANSSSIPSFERDVRYTVTHFSIIGYSLGGLIARYVVGALFGRGFFKTPTSHTTSTFRPVIPVNFVTLATPHIGIPPTDTFWGTTMASLGKVALGRTGEQLYCADREWVSVSLSARQGGERTPLLAASQDSQGRSLLEAMADPSTPFFKALALFRNKAFYGSAKHDLTVPFRTALIELDDPFAEDMKETVQLKFVDGYPHLIETFAVLPPASQTSTPPSTPTNAWNRIHFHVSSAARAIASTSQKAIKKAVTPLMVFRPSRFPYQFPLNYLASFLAPVAFPLLLAYMIFQTTSYVRASVERITHERRAWAVTYAGSGSVSPRGALGTNDALQRLDEVDMEQLERNRIAQILFGVSMELEDGSECPKPDESFAGSSAAIDATSQPTNQADRDDNVPIFSTRQVDWKGPVPPSAMHTQHKAVAPLTEVQQRMVRNLQLLPGLCRRAAYFEGTFNAHSVIIVRRPHLAANQLGIDVVRHMAASFQL